KRRPKSHRQSNRFSKFHPFSNVKSLWSEYWEQLTLNIENNSYSVSGATYTQYQLTPSIDSISFPIPGETAEVQNMFINQSTSSSSFVRD
ncbi:33360_t:CDS:2, partial [Gigaspora margarita]